jgi:hypothetical protein
VLGCFIHNNTYNGTRLWLPLLGTDLELWRIVDNIPPNICVT